MLLSDLSSDQEATGSNSHGGGGGGDHMVVGSHGAHVVLSNLFLPPVATTMLLPPAVMVRPAAMAVVEEEPKAKKKRSLPGNPDPEAEVIALSPRALVATNRFVCEVCNKGFQRDQNLQLHRRGHNLPCGDGGAGAEEEGPTCVHHDPARALGDLTGIKKHFSRKHGEKRWRCERCGKRYAVHSDWKAHVKNCGTREYRCDCGILFSRKDSLLTHRAFCDALAEESARLLAAANNSGSITTCNNNSSSNINSISNNNNLLITSSSSSSPPLFLPFSTTPPAAENPNPNPLLFLQQHQAAHHHQLLPQFQLPSSPPAYFDHLAFGAGGVITGSSNDDNSSIAGDVMVAGDSVSFGLTSEGSVTMHAGVGRRLTRDFLGVDHDAGEVEELELDHELPLSTTTATATACQGCSFAATTTAVSRAACCATDFTTGSRQYLGRLPPVNETWSHNF
uniref:C2H2-type domain-containing protein n=1 Tax=Oryza punctata TaxID=4537 RepID=A0A0E0M7R6_ORYPU